MNIIQFEMMVTNRWGMSRVDITRSSDWNLHVGVSALHGFRVVIRFGFIHLKT